MNCVDLWGLTASDSQAASDSSWWQKFSNCFGCDIKYGFGVGVNINTGSWISVDAKIDLGTYTLTSDGNGISDTDATLDISKSVDLTSSTDNDDIKLGIGGQFFIGLDIWVNLTDLWELLTN